MKKTKIIALSVIVTAVVVVLLLILIKGALGSLSGAPVQASRGKQSLQAEILQDGAFTYNDSSQLLGYALVGYTARNYVGMNISLDYYKMNPVQQIYLLNVTDYCYQCISQGEVVSEGALYSSLANDLSDYGLTPNSSSFSYISFRQLGSLPRNSIVIIPSGLMPITLMPSSQFQNTSANLLTLLSRGDTIFYIGDNFSRSAGILGTVYNTQGQINYTLQSAGIGMMPYTSNTDALRLYFDSPTWNFTGNGAYKVGQIVYVNRYNGTILALPNTQQVGWANISALASDITKVLYSRVWITSLASDSVLPPIQNSNESSGSIGVLTLRNPFNTTTNTSLINDSYPLVRIQIFNLSGATAALDLPFRSTYKYNGTIGMPTVIGETEPFQSSITIQTSRKQEIISSLSMMSANMTNVLDIPLSFFNITPAVNTVIKQVVLDLPPGVYIAMLRSSNNTYYSGAGVVVSPINVTPTYLNYQNATFNFSLKSNGWPVSGLEYNITLNGKNASTGILQNGEITYSLPKGSTIPFGNEMFTINVLGVGYAYFGKYQQQVFNIPTIYIEFGAVIIFIVALNLVVKAPNRDEYYIDVESLPEAKKVPVKVDKKSIIDIFDKMNFYYRWKYMPMTTDEVRAGISQNLRYGSLPIAITTQNASFILNSLTVQGDLANVGEYYMPVSWITASGHGPEYLTIFRRLRDHCIANAVLFTDLGVSEHEDMVITKNGISSNIIIYTKEKKSADMERNINIEKNSRLFLVFLNDIERSEFVDTLHASYGGMAEILKMGIYYGNIKLVDVENLGDMVF